MIVHHKGLLSFKPSRIGILHCISSDCAMGAGFAAQVPEIHKKYVRAQPRLPISCMHSSYFGNLRIFHLITKMKVSDKPTWNDFAFSVRNFALTCDSFNVSRINCPRIGAGLDGLPWNKVEDLLALLPITFNVYTPTPEELNAVV